jgi:hypothetical protein
LSRIASGIAVVMTLVIAGGVAERSIALPAPEELLPDTVALVSDVPGGWGRITKAEFRHELELVAVQAKRIPAPKPGETGYERLERQALHSMLEAAWLRGEAAEMEIFVTHRQVSRLIAQIKAEGFKSAAEYRQFLRESHYTRRDVNERVEVQLLATRIGKRIERQIEREARNEFEEKRAFNEFIAEFNERWRARTVCAPEYATDRCSNGPLPGVGGGGRGQPPPPLPRHRR